MDIGLIISAVFLVFIALAALIGYGKGKKYVWQYTLTRLIINILAVVIAIPVTRLISKKIIDEVFNTVLKNELDSEGSLFTNLTVALDIGKALAAMMVGLFLFFFVRLVVKFILKFFKYSIFSLITSISDFIGGKLSKKAPKAQNAAKNGSKKPEFDVSLVTAPAANAAYKFCFRNGKKNNITSYFLDGTLYGTSNSQHTAVTTPGTAADVYLVPNPENSEYCYLKMETANGTKYVNIICGANGQVNAFLGDTFVTEYIYDQNLGTLVTVVNDETYMLAADQSNKFVYAQNVNNAANVPYVRLVEVTRNPDAVSTEEFTQDADDSVVVESVQPQQTKKPKKKEGCYALKPQLASILIGIFGCIFGVVVVFAPFTGLIGMADDALNVVKTAMGDELAEDEELSETLNMVSGITGNFSVKFSNAYGGRIIFNRLTTYKVNDTKIKLKNEVKLVTTIASSGMTITNEDAEKDVKIDAVEDILDAFDKSSIIPLLLADIINQAAVAIENGEEFMGIINADDDDDYNDDYNDDYYGSSDQYDDDEDDMGEAISEKLISELVSSYKNCTPESIKNDVRMFGNIVIIFIRHDAIETLTDDAEGLLAAKDLIKELLEAFFDNDRVSSLVSTFVEIGIEILETQLGMADTLEEPYNKMKEELAALDQSYSAEDNKKPVANVFYKYGIDITDNGAYTVAQALKTNRTYMGIDMEAVLGNVEINNNGNTAFVNLSTLEGFENASVLITKKEVVITHKNSVSNPANEAQCIANALFAITDLTEKMDESDELEISAILSTVGTILDNLANTEIVGKDVVDKLLLVMFQSEELGENLPMNTVQITSFVNSLIASSGKNGYSAVMSGIGDMVDALQKLSDAENVDSVEALGDVLKTITPETAEALKHFATTDFVGELGVDDESAEGAANVLGTLFDELATAKDPNGLNLSDEEYQAEADKIANLLDVTMSISDGSGDNSDVSFGDFVDDVMDSKILTNTVINSVCDENGAVVNRDPLNTGMELDADDEKELVDSLQEKLDANKTEDNKKLVVAIAAYMNVDVYVNAEGKIITRN